MGQPRISGWLEDVESSLEPPRQDTKEICCISCGKPEGNLGAWVDLEAPPNSVLAKETGVSPEPAKVIICIRCWPSGKI